MMAAIARHTVVPRAASPALAGRARRAGEAVRLPGSARAATRVTLGASRRGKAVVPAAGVELAQLAELDSETVTIAIAAVVGLAAGLGVPIFFVMQVRLNWIRNPPIERHRAQNKISTRTAKTHSTRQSTIPRSPPIRFSFS